MLGSGRRVGQVIKELVVVIRICLHWYLIEQFVVFKNNTTDTADHSGIRGQVFYNITLTKKKQKLRLY
jgi:hypothetical protein